jgi:hypothetical protein
MADPNERLTPLRRQWGQNGMVPAGLPTGPIGVMDATAQNASRLAVTLGAAAGTVDTRDMTLVVRSAIESGVWERTFYLQSYGLCVQVPQGRVTAAIHRLTTNPVAYSWSATFGEGFVSREWQTELLTLTAGAKGQAVAPHYSRRVRVSVGTGGVGASFNVSTGSVNIGVVQMLAAPGGQTFVELTAPDIIALENTGAGTAQGTIEWEVLA